MPSFIRNIFLKRAVKQILDYLETAVDIVWSFDPFRFQNLRFFLAKHAIYHPVDIHHSPFEMQAVETADVVFSTAHKILERFAKPQTPMYFINHGLAKHFLVETQYADLDIW